MPEGLPPNAVGLASSISTFALTGGTPGAFASDVAGAGGLGLLTGDAGTGAPAAANHLAEVEEEVRAVEAELEAEELELEHAAASSESCFNQLFRGRYRPLRA